MIKTTLETQGQRIKNARKEKGISQEELAKLAETTQQTIQRWEKNERGLFNPNLGTMKKIALVLNVTLDYLMTGKGEKNDSSFFDVKCIPVIEWKDIFNWILGKGKPKMNLDLCETIPLLNGLNGNCFGIRLNGAVKQTPTGYGFMKGEIIIVDTDIKAQVGDFVIVSINDNHSIHLRQLVEINNKQALQSDGMNYSFVSEKTVFHGVVVGSHRKFRS
jgi:transcriptional regulator with XRE-family HTH domain